MNNKFSAQINIQPSAIHRICELLAVENNFNLKLRIYIVGGGCSGFQYAFAFEQNAKANDIEVKSDIPSAISTKLNHPNTPSFISIIVDPISISYLQGASLEFISDLTGSRFKVSNPNAASTCSCGSSFAI